MKKIINKLREGVGTGGFTMIELLVVIAVIGVLAVAVLSSINPLEQINKGRDTKKRSNAAQLINAIDRFYAIHEVFPWGHASYGNDTILNDDAYPDGVIYGAEASPLGFYLIGGPDYTAPADNWLEGLSSTDEVKESFINQLEAAGNTNALYVIKAAEAVGVDDSVYVCFTPSSKAFEQQAVDDCTLRKSLLPGSACSQDQATYDAGALYVDELICLP